MEEDLHFLKRFKAADFHQDLNVRVKYENNQCGFNWRWAHLSLSNIRDHPQWTSQKGGVRPFHANFIGRRQICDGPLLKTSSSLTMMFSFDPLYLFRLSTIISSLPIPSLNISTSAIRKYSKSTIWSSAFQPFWKSTFAETSWFLCRLRSSAAL